MNKQITIGGVLVTVPAEYLKAEEAHCKLEMATFYNTHDRSAKAIARDIVLAKRVEFHEKYLAGKVSITPPTPVKTLSIWRKIARWSLGHKN